MVSPPAIVDVPEESEEANEPLLSTEKVSVPVESTNCRKSPDCDALLDA